MRRSRPKAHRLAGQLLDQTHVSDDGVLKVLRLWHFNHNRTRANVMPAGVDSVQSDTLGLVRSRDGRVLATISTVKFSNVFALLCRWLRDHHPDGLAMSFPFTSISVNFAYAAKIHRDSNNLGPSVTKAFGPFSGGQLLYWRNDDAVSSLEKLLTLNDARPLDTKRYLVLFDGLRAHAVTPFEGERSSFVFFTANHYDRARPTVVKALVGSGAQWPSYASLKYYAQLIGPPKGYVAPSQSILRFLGRSEREPMLKWIGRTFLTLGEDIVAEALSYVLRPRDMPDICAVCRGLAGAAWAPNAWSGSLVDAAAIKPLGVRAKRHYTLWGRARIIIGGRWQFGIVSLLMSNRVALWRWQELGGSPFLVVESSCAMVSHSQVPPKRHNDLRQDLERRAQGRHRGIRERPRFDRYRRRQRREVGGHTVL